MDIIGHIMSPLVSGGASTFEKTEKAKDMDLNLKNPTQKTTTMLPGQQPLNINTEALRSPHLSCFYPSLAVC